MENGCISKNLVYITFSFIVLSATHVKLDSFDNQVFANFYVSSHYENPSPFTLHRVAVLSQ